MKRYRISEDSVLLKWLRSRYGNGPPELIARRISEQLLGDTRQTVPPVNLRLLFGRRRIKGYAVSKMEEDGRLLVNRDGFKIEVKDSWETRTRFTLAHEIGHTFFYDLDRHPPQRLLQSTHLKDEEAFCSILAAELLMPAQMVATELGKQEGWGDLTDPTVVLRRLADLFKVSLEAMTRRIIEDLKAVNGVVMSVRWLTRNQRSDDCEDAEPGWRLWWWAASPQIIEPLFLPPVKGRPRLNLGVIDTAFLNGEPGHFGVALKEIRFGNLRKILRGLLNDSVTIQMWVHPICPKGVQVSSITPESEATNAVDKDAVAFVRGDDRPSVRELLRERTEVIIFIPIKIADKS